MSESGQLPDYNRMHVKWAASYVPIKKAKVLIVGCNTGGDCKNFIDAGAREVWGVDVVDSVGRSFTHPMVHYLKNSVEEMEIDSDTFDLVFSLATMEHVPDIGKGFAEMGRVTRPGGWIYSVASPLWNSPFGHHKPDLFQRHPWVHLLHSRDEIVALGNSEKVIPADGESLAYHVDYMLNAEFFNMTPARCYLNVCANLEHFEILRNGFDFLPGEFLTERVENQLGAKGLSRQELLAVTHYFIARKSGGRDPLKYFPGGLKDLFRKVSRRVRAYSNNMSESP